MDLASARRDEDKDRVNRWQCYSSSGLGGASRSTSSYDASHPSHARRRRRRPPRTAAAPAKSRPEGVGSGTAAASAAQSSGVTSGPAALSPKLLASRLKSARFTSPS